MCILVCRRPKAEAFPKRVSSPTMTSDITIRDVRADDAAALIAIYNPYIRESIFTFEETEITAADMAARIEAVIASYPWFVAEREGKIVGYAYVSRYHERVAY